MDLEDDGDGRRARPSPDFDLRRALDRVDDGVFTLDTDWTFTYMNSAAAQMTGARVGDLVGRNIWEAYPQAVSSVYQDRFHEAMEAQRVVEFEELWDLVEPIRSYFSIRVHPSPEGLTVVFRDVSHLHALMNQRKVLLDRLIEAEERERARIAAGLHDDSLQALGVVRLRLELLRAYAGELPPKVAAVVDGLDVVVAEAIDRMRGALFSLEPTDVDAPLEESIRNSASQLFAGTAIEWRVLSDPNVAELALPERTQALRIAKEALHNVRAHAKASRVEVVLRGLDGGLELTVTDDGLASDPSTFTTAPGHRGLTTMRDRAEVVGGWFALEPAQPHGCTARCFLPLHPQPQP